MIILTSFAADVMDKVIDYLPKPPKDLSILFIPTAANPYKEKDWMSVDRKKLVDLGFIVTNFNLKGKNEDKVRNAVANTDIVFVSGGNAFYLLKYVRKSGFDRVVKDLINKNLIYIGSSAGSVILGPNIEPMKYLDDSSYITKSTENKGLGIIEYVILPHFDNKKYDSYYKKLIKEYKDKYDLKPLNDNQAIIINNKGSKLITN